MLLPKVLYHARFEMLIYGRQEYQDSIKGFAARLCRRVAITRPDSVPELRALLIQCGQLEQAVHDAPNPTGHRQLLSASTHVTDWAAAAFYSVWANGGESSFAASCLASMVAELDSFLQAELPLVTFRIPEGFEFYGLFPEQYCCSAIQWARAHEGASTKRALVIGIRSIGTTLSALVKVALDAAGWRAERITVRPMGHPFGRTVELGPEMDEYKSALIVDEGPGLSGSSMAAVARALAARSVEDIAFLPGHVGEPGTAASDETRRWWAKTPRFFTPLGHVRWRGLSLTEALYRQCSCNGPPALSCADFSAGLWRKRVYVSESDWPAVSTTFERMKYCCTNLTGESILWKFAGFGCVWEGGITAAELALEQMNARADLGLCPRPLGIFNGFIGMPWVEGARANRTNVESILPQLGNYLARSTGPELTQAAAQAAYTRLSEMLLHNVKETLGEALAERAQVKIDQADTADCYPCYGDGRMAPHEWVRAADGAFWKTDSTGHDRDHTVIGKQPFLWDVAGAIIEWDLGAERTDALLEPLRRAGLPVDRGPLLFYQLAYAAFRLGLTSLSASQLSPADRERLRLEYAARFYSGALERLLK